MHYRVFSHDVKAAVLVFQTNPVGVELSKRLKHWFSCHCPVSEQRFLIRFDINMNLSRGVLEVLLRNLSSIKRFTTSTVKQQHLFPVAGNFKQKGCRGNQRNVHG